MATEVKGFFKWFKHITQTFVAEDHELEIGYPTDVKHIGHIGCGSGSMDAPSWMDEFGTPPDFSSTSLCNFGQSPETSWASQELGQRKELQTSLGTTSVECCLPEIRRAPKKIKRKKSKASSCLMFVKIFKKGIRIESREEY